MFKPSEMQCDFCQNAIVQGQHFVEVGLPLPKSVRNELVEWFERQVAPKPVSSPFGLMNASADQAVPYVWKLHICAPCAFSILPNVADTIRKQVRDYIEAQLATKRRSDRSYDELEEAASS